MAGEEHTTHVKYKALVDFQNLSRALQKLKKDLAEVQAAEEKLNKASVEGQKKSERARERAIREMDQHSFTVDRNTGEVIENTDAISDNTDAVLANAKALDGLEGKNRQLTSAERRLTQQIRQGNTAAQQQVAQTNQQARALGNLERSYGSLQRAARNGRRIPSFLPGGGGGGGGNDSFDNIIGGGGGGDRFDPLGHGPQGGGGRHRRSDADDPNTWLRRTEANMSRVTAQGGRLLGNLRRIGNWRPSLIPPFIALVPIIGAILALINPLVAGIGAVGMALAGLVQSAGSAASGLLVIAPGLSSLLANFTAVRMAFKGVGDAIKKEIEARVGTAAPVLSRSARSFVRSAADIAVAWRGVRREVQESFFSQFVGDMGRLNGLLPALQTLLTASARAMGRFTSNFLKLVTNDEWKRDIADFGAINERITDGFGSGFLNLLDIFRNLTMAAAPLLERFSRAFSEGSRNLNNLISTARQDGSLQSWLTEVGDRIAIWWQAIKDFGATLGNFGRAMSPFSDWMLGGLADMMNSWREASERAMEPGSAFRQYLEDIKPLLREVDGLLGDFFSWFGREAADQDNITEMTRIIKLIRDELGPSISGIIDTLQETGIGTAFVKALTSIVETIEGLLKNGGAEGFKDFLNTVEDLFDAISDIANDPAMEPFISFFVKAMATLAAITFVGKFTGLFALFSWLLKLGASRGVLSILRAFSSAGLLGGLRALAKIPGLGALGAILGIGSGIDTGANGKDRPVGENVGNGALAGGGIGFAVGGPVGGLIGAIAGALFGGSASIGSYDSLDGPAGDIVLAFYRALEQAFKDTPFGNYMGILGDKLEEAFQYLEFGDNFDLGKFFETIFDTEETFAAAQAFWEDFGKNFQEGWDGFWGDVGKWFEEMPEKLSEAWNTVWTGFQEFVRTKLSELFTGGSEGKTNAGSGLIGWLGQQWENAKQWFIDLPYNVGFLVGSIWREIQTFREWLVEKWNEASAFIASLPYAFGMLVGDIWRNIRTARTWIEERRREFATFILSLPAAFGAWAGDVWRNVQTARQWLAKQLVELRTWFVNLPNNIRQWAGDVWRNIQTARQWLAKQLVELRTWFVALPGRVRGWVGNIWNNIQGPLKVLGGWASTITGWAAKLPGMVARAVGNIFRFITGSFSAGVQAGANGVKISRHHGGIIPQYLSSGGRVRQMGDLFKPRGEDTVPAMLQPGEFVMRKRAVDSLGEGMLQKLNDRGAMAFSDMLSGVQRQPFPSSQSVGMFPSMQPALPTSTGQNIGVWIENLNINNPVREETETSLARTVRKFANT